MQIKKNYSPKSEIQSQHTKEDNITYTKRRYAKDCRADFTVVRLSDDTDRTLFLAYCCYSTC